MSRGVFLLGSRRCFTRIARQLWRTKICCCLFSHTAYHNIPHTKHVEVPCASSGHVIVSLHDIQCHPATAPVILHLPPFPVEDITDVSSYLPSFLHRYPTATIHYRWPITGQSSSRCSTSTRLHWPIPFQDTVTAYDHIIKQLAPPPCSANRYSSLQRRRLYLYSSYLGATLGASLALTECHTHHPVAVRGLVAINGIYDWTTFLPDHKLHQLRQRLEQDEGIEVADHVDVQPVRDLLPRLFSRPGDLFDPFASPVLFFRNPGLPVPPGFRECWKPPTYVQSVTRPPATGSADHVDPDKPLYPNHEDLPPLPPTIQLDGDYETDTEHETFQEGKPPIVMAQSWRPGYLTFPPSHSTLEIPETLFLHSMDHYPTLTDEGSGRADLDQLKKVRKAENSYASQAKALAGFMRRSVERLELKDRKKWEDEGTFPDWREEVLWRVGLGDMGVVGTGEVGKRGERMATQWFEQRLSRVYTEPR